MKNTEIAFDKKTSKIIMQTLEALKATEEEALIFLVNGIKINGFVKDYDTRCIAIGSHEDTGISQYPKTTVVMLNAVASIVMGD